MKFKPAIILILTFALVILSCKKNRTCYCERWIEGNSGSQTTQEYNETVKATKLKVFEECHKFDNSYWGGASDTFLLVRENCNSF